LTISIKVNLYTFYQNSYKISTVFKNGNNLETKKDKVRLLLRQNTLDINEQLTKSFRFQNRELLDNYIILAVTDIDGIIKHVTTNLCNVFGYKASDLLHKSYNFLIDKNALKNFENQFLDAKETTAMWKGELKHRARNDEIIWTDTIITPLFNDNDEHIGFILASSDITKEKKLKKLNEENLLKQKQDKTILEFMPSLSSAVLLKTSSGLHKILWLVALTIIFLLIWSSLSKIDDIVKSQGKVITTQNTQTISSLNGGILKEVYVKEGDFVKAKQKILKIADNDYKIELDKNIQQKMALIAKITRLEAQANNKPLQVNNEVLQYNKILMNNEIELFTSNKKKLDSSLEILKEQIEQKYNDLADAKKNLRIAKANKELLIKEIKIKQPLVEQRIISKVEFLQLKKQINDINSEIESLQISISSLKSSIQEAKNTVNETTQTYYAAARDDLVKTYNELQNVQEDIAYLNQKMTDTTIISPSDGTINKIMFKTQGEAISPGGVIVTITPKLNKLLAEVKVSPADIGFLYVGQAVRLKLRAYDFSLYGAIDAKISYISADTVIDDMDQKSEVFIVHIESDQTYVGDNKKLIAKPGMSVDADIITGKRSILQYVLKPITKSLDR